jgi:hypothetical protein
MKIFLIKCIESKEENHDKFI